MWCWYAGQVQYARGGTGGSGAVHIRQQGQSTRDIIEDGIEDSRLVEDGTREIQAVGPIHLYETGRHTMTTLEIVGAVWITLLVLDFIL